MLFGHNPVTIGILSANIALAATLLYLAYRWLVDQGYTEGYAGFVVVPGVLITLAGVLIVDVEAARLAFYFFVCSGVPVLTLSSIRYAMWRKAERDALRKEALDESP